jgi:plasmid stabilization system protein ParE
VTRPVRFTRAAEASLGEIADWTIDTFGPAQALRYEAELLERCMAIVEGRVHSRDCSALAPEGRGLRYVRAGEHFLVYAELEDAVVIVEVLHSRSDLPARLARVTDKSL